MLCPYCGSANPADQRYCRRCAALVGRVDAPLRAPPLRVAPLQGALSRVLPLPCGTRVGAARPAVLVAGSAGGRPIAVVPAGPADRHPAAGSTAAAAGHQGRASGHALAWLSAGLVVSAAVFAAAHLTLRGPAAQWWAALVPALEGRASAPDGEVVAEPAPAPAPAPAPHVPEQAADGRALASQIDAHLQRMGVQGIEVTPAAGGALTVRGLLATPQDRAALLGWLRAQPGVADIDDRTEVVPLPAAPAPRTVQRPERAAAPAPMPSAVPERVTPPIRDAAPARPDPGALARQVQRELGRLGLSDVGVDVDPATLQITLRGRTNDAGGKVQALAYARSLWPGSRVRDLVFLVEE